MMCHVTCDDQDDVVSGCPSVRLPICPSVSRDDTCLCHVFNDDPDVVVLVFPGSHVS